MNEPNKPECNRVLHNSRLKGLASDTYSSFFDPFVSYEENEVLWILTQIFFSIVLSFIDEISSSGPIGGVAGPSLSPLTSQPGNTNWGGRLSTVDLLIKVACFVKK